MWTLNGIASSFKLEGFNFSRPHDARFVSSDETTETITLLDNAGDEQTQIADFSSALIIDLDKSTWTARVRTRWVRYVSPFHSVHRIPLFTNHDT